MSLSFFDESCPAQYALDASLVPEDSRGAPFNIMTAILLAISNSSSKAPFFHCPRQRLTLSMTSRFAALMMSSVTTKPSMIDSADRPAVQTTQKKRYRNRECGSRCGKIAETMDVGQKSGMLYALTVAL